MDYHKWLERAVEFSEHLRRLPGNVRATIQVAPPLSDSQVTELIKACKLPIPAPLRDWWTQASGHCNIEFHWDAPAAFHPQMRVAFPHWKLEDCWGGAQFEPARDLAELVDSTAEPNDNLRRKHPRDARYWENSLPLIPVGNGDYVGLYVRDNPDAPEVTYLNHEACGASQTIAPDWDTFLRQWEQLRYIGIHFLSGFIDEESELLQPELFPQELEALSSLLRGEPRPDLTPTQRPMTADRWANCANPEVLLDWLQAEATLESRKLRLFCCACCRRVQQGLGESGRRTVEVSERFADGQADAAELAAARAALSGGMGGEGILQALSNTTENIRKQWELPGSAPKEEIVDRFMERLWATIDFSTREGVMHHAAYSAADASTFVCWEIHRHLDEPELQREKAAQAALVHHIFGDPFRTVAPPNGLPFSAMKAAQRLYNGEPCADELRAALFTAGHSELADHFREPAHPKGCWALDLILRGGANGATDH